MSKEEKRHTAEIINPGLGDIEKVRDILFGKYVANFQQRFEELEKRLEADADKLQTRLVKKIASMDETLKEAIKKIEAHVEASASERDTELVTLNQSVSETETKLQHSISLIEDETSQNLAAMHEQLNALRQEVVDKAVTQQRRLDKDKVSRQALALLLDEVAVKLRRPQE